MHGELLVINELKLFVEDFVSKYVLPEKKVVATEDLMNSIKRIHPLYDKDGKELFYSYKDRMKVIKKCADDHNISVEDLVGKSRKQEIISAKVDAINRLKFAGLNYTEIAHTLGYKDHSIIVFHLKKKNVDNYVDRMLK